MALEIMGIKDIIIVQNKIDLVDKEALEIIKRIEDSKDFRIEQSNDQRALYGSFAGNRKKSLQTEEGRKFLQEMMIKLTKVNEYTVGRMLIIFGHVDNMEEKRYI